MVLYGQYVVVVDAAGGWSAPEAFAPALAEGSVATAGLDGCLWLYPMASWQAFVERVSPALALTQPAAREFARRTFGQARTLTPGNNTLSLPESLRQIAAIDREMVMAGLVDHFELWSPQRWEAQIAHADATWQKELSALGI